MGSFRLALGLIAAIASCCVAYSAIYGHIAATAHSNPIKPSIYIAALCAVMLLMCSITILWPLMRWFSILLALLVAGTTFVILLRFVWLPFP